MTRNSVISLICVALGLGACGKDTPPATSPDGGGAVAANDDGAGTEDAVEDGTDDLEPDPDSADDWDPEAGGSGYVADEGPVSPVEDPRADITEPTQMATVTIEIKSGGGKVRKNSPQYVQWNQLTRIPVDFQGQIHEFDVQVKNNGGNVGVILSYNVGADAVLADYSFDTKPKFREVLRIEDGMALAITVTPKTVKPYSKKEREKLEGKSEKDPLAGAK